MYYEIALLSACLFVASVVVTVFFCGVEAAPNEARKVARASRYAGLMNPKKLVRFWKTT